MIPITALRVVGQAALGLSAGIPAHGPWTMRHNIMRNSFNLLPLALLGVLTTTAARAEKPLWQGIPGIEQTAKGRLFVTWYSGGTHEPQPENTVYLTRSDDQGETFTTPEILAAPRDGARAFDPTLWIDPRGRLWLIFNRGNKDTAQHTIHARRCEAPDATPPVWSEEFRIDLDVPVAFRMNKPTVLSTGAWVLPVTHAPEPTFDWFAQEKQVQGVAVSTDEGQSWTLHGAVEAPRWALENMIVERNDGRLWMLIRAGGGFLWQSHSDDGGTTWSESSASSIASPGSRFFIRRLESGNLLLVNHHRFTGRSHMTAQLSTDDGQTWNGGLLLDERSGVSYPDAIQSPDGLIRVVYDRDRKGSGDILMATFREEDVAAGKDVSGDVRLRQVVSTLQAPPSISLLPADWDPKQAADRVMDGLINVCAPEVKGAHDSDLLLHQGKAYVIYMANDRQAGEAPQWPFIYVTLSIVDLDRREVEAILPVAASEMAFENATLPVGACFVPRLLQVDDSTLRCFFASEEPGRRESQTWYRDFDVPTRSLAPTIHKAKLQTADGVVDMQPGAFHRAAQAHGFEAPARDYGLYMIDSFKRFDGEVYAVLNNFAGGQNALGKWCEDWETLEILGHYNEPSSMKLTESSVNRLPDGTWLAISRQEAGTRNYAFTRSVDGKQWSTHEYREDVVPNGTNSKPTLDRFGEVYYLGWQEATRIEGVSRSVFNLDISREGKTWERKYRFESTHAFQYPNFRESDGTIYLTVTQGDTSDSRKERIMFGVLESRNRVEP